MIAPDGTGIDWRRTDDGIQHRYGAELFRNGRPGPWITTEGVADIVHPARVAAIGLLEATTHTGPTPADTRRDAGE